MSFKDKINEGDKDKCEFFGFLGIVNQSILGVLTFSFLIIKRFIEKPRRHWFIWFFDVLKQIISSMTLYSANMTFSYILRSSKENASLCSIYFMNLFMGCVGGYFITKIYISLFYFLKKKYKLKIYMNEIYYEEYFDKHHNKKYRLKKYIYFFETISWTLIQLIWKIILLAIFFYFSYIFIEIGDKVLKPFNSQGIKLFMVLCVFPLTLNGIYYWKIDSLVKKRKEQYFVQVKCANEE